MLYSTPGVYREDLFLAPQSALATGVPLFIGYAKLKPRPPDEPEDAPILEIEQPFALSDWSEFTQQAEFPESPVAYLGYAVRGFFENGGTSCYVLLLDDTLPTRTKALEQALSIAATVDGIDLVCAPDILRPIDAQGVIAPLEGDVRQQQKDILDYCQAAGDRVALLDPLPTQTVTQMITSRAELDSDFGALYYPWVRPTADAPGGNGFIPASGHIAGIIARSDAANGVFKAPANEVVEGVVNLETSLSPSESGQLNEVGINALRAFTGRGLRVWGARTLSALPQWRYLNVRRLFLTVGRWLEVNMPAVTFEPNDPRLWERIRREVGAYLGTLFTQGALQGQAPSEAFYVKCDAETNPPATRELGQVITEIGIAALHPGEFIVVRIIHGTTGVSIV